MLVKVADASRDSIYSGSAECLRVAKRLTWSLAAVSKAYGRAKLHRHM